MLRERETGYQPAHTPDSFVMEFSYGSKKTDTPKRLWKDNLYLHYSCHTYYIMEGKVKYLLLVLLPLG